MNIVFISNQPFPIGMAGSKRIRLFAQHLAKNNSVKVIVVGKNNGNNTFKGVFKKVDFSFTKFNRIQTFLSFFKIKNILKQNFKTGEQNIIFLYDGIGLTNFLFAALGKKMGYKIVTDVVEDYSVHQEKTSFLLSTLHKINCFFEKRTFKFVDGVIVISNCLMTKFERLNFANNPLILIPVSAENLFQPVVKTKKNDFFTFIYSGSYGIKDGIDILIGAFDFLTQRHKKVHLILAGKISNSIKNKIAGNKNIIDVGMVDENKYFDFIGNADVLLMTRINSKYANSGFPFKLGEYLATSNAVIATSISDVEKYLIDKQDVILAEPSNINSLVQAMEYALSDKERLISIGINGRKKCEIFFNPKINGELLNNFFTQVFKNDSNISQ